MKIYLALIPAVLGLVAVPQVQANNGSTQAKTCEVIVVTGDRMSFDKKELEINTACKEFKIILKHNGRIPKTAMGHNIVISKVEDTSGVLRDGAAATLKRDFVKEGDTRVLAYTKLIGGGEEASVTVDTSKFDKNSRYEFYCSFPGHYGLMRGPVRLI